MPLVDYRLPDYRAGRSVPLRQLPKPYDWFDARYYPPGVDGSKALREALARLLGVPASKRLSGRISVHAVVVPRNRYDPPCTSGDGDPAMPFPGEFVRRVSNDALVVVAFVAETSGMDGAIVRVYGWIQGDALKKRAAKDAGDVFILPVGRLNQQYPPASFFEEKKREHVDIVEEEEEEDIEEVADEPPKRGRQRMPNVTPLLYRGTPAESDDDFRCSSSLMADDFADEQFRKRAVECTVLRMRCLLACSENTAKARELTEAVEAMAPDDDYLSFFCLAAMCFTGEASPEHKRWLQRAEEQLFVARLSHAAPLFSSYEGLERMLKRNRVLLFIRSAPDRYRLIYPVQDPSIGELSGNQVRALRRPVAVRCDLRSDESEQARAEAIRSASDWLQMRPPIDAPWLKLPFHAVPENLRDASLHLERGWVYMPVGAARRWLVGLMLGTLRRLLESNFWNTDIGQVIAQTYPEFRAACREVQDSAPRERRKQKQREDLGFDLPDIEDAMLRVMPACVTNLHLRLSRGDHHLQYYERLQLARTLASCGYDSADIFSYMVGHASKGANWDRAKENELRRLPQDIEKERSKATSGTVFDLEDPSQRRQFTALEGLSCKFYIEMQQNANNHNGCPFANMSDAELRALLSDSGQLSETKIRDLLAERRGDAKRACTAHLTVRMALATRTTEKQVIETMRGADLRRPKKYFSYLAAATTAPAM